MQVAVAGTGRMGTAIAERLLHLGHTVRVWNRTRAKAEPLAAKGAIVCTQPVEIARSSEAIISMLTDAAAIEASAAARPLQPIFRKKTHAHTPRMSAVAGA